MKISKFTCIRKFIFGGPTGVVDYLFDCGNNLIAQLASGKETDVKEWVENAKKLLDSLRKAEWLCPEKWRKAYSLTVYAFESVVIAIEDLKVEQTELSDIVKAFKVAYAEWRAE